jgi:hypothetical protein
LLPPADLDLLALDALAIYLLLALACLPNIDEILAALLLGLFLLAGTTNPPTLLFIAIVPVDIASFLGTWAGVLPLRVVVVYAAFFDFLAFAAIISSLTCKVCQ